MNHANRLRYRNSPRSETPMESWFALWTRFAARAGRSRATRRRSGSRRFCRPSPGGAAGRIARRRSTGRCFPGYCFARFDPRERLPILKCAGVVNIVSFDGEPAPIPEHEIDSIRLLVESDLATIRAR